MKEGNQDDKMLERLLAGLGAAPVEDDFAQRVMRGVEARTFEADLHPARERVALWGFASVAAAVLLCLVAARELRHGSSAAPTARNMRLAFPRILSRSEGPTASEDSAVKPAASRHRVPTRRKAAGGAVPLGSAALVSFPAPESPLTEQERLLLRIAHRADPVEVAMLDPQELARQEAADAAEFQQFFPPPPPPDDVVPDDPTKEKGDSK